MSDFDPNTQGQQPQNTQEQSEPKKVRPKPEVIRDGDVKSTIFRNESRHGEFTTAKFSKVYRDEHGTVRETNNFTADEVLKLGVVARKSYDRMGKMRREQFMKKRESQAQSHHRNNGDRSR